jgi:hypothetical protein
LTDCPVCNLPLDELRTLDDMEATANIGEYIYACPHCDSILIIEITIKNVRDGRDSDYQEEDDING